MTLLQSIILGIVQGITEFFPVSSSAHLRMAKWLMGIPDGEHLLYFDLVCHSGTLLALILFLRRDIFSVLCDRKAIALFALALFPLVPAYFLLKPFRIAASDPAYLGYFLIATSFLLFFASRGNCKTSRLRKIEDFDAPCKDRLAGPVSADGGLPERVGESALMEGASKGRFCGGGQFCNCLSGKITVKEQGIKVKDVLCIGIMQTMALLPGISRSGSTIAMGRLLGWDWVAAARFSFLLAIPAILGGQALETYKLLSGPAGGAAIPTGCYAAGFCASFAIGLIGVRFIFKIYEKGIVRPFAWYCLSAGILALWVLHG